MPDLSFDEEVERAARDIRRRDQLEGLNQKQRQQKQNNLSGKKGRISRLESIYDLPSQTAAEARVSQPNDAPSLDRPREEEVEENVEVPFVIGLSPREAQSILSQSNLNGFEVPIPTPGINQSQVVGTR